MRNTNYILNQKLNKDIPEKELDLSLLFQEIHTHTGVDLSNYSADFLKRKLERLTEERNFKNVQDILDHYSPEFGGLQALVNYLTVNYSELFRDPEFYAAIRTKVFPYLATFQKINIWHAGCSSGEEVYSLAILLHEVGLLENCSIMASDIHTGVLQQAKSGIYSSVPVQASERNYYRAGGQSKLTDYFIGNNSEIRFKEFLKRRIQFYQHNLLSDPSPTSCHLILCRNVLIYFSAELHDQAIKNFTKSLSNLGYLGLGIREGIKGKMHSGDFACIDKEARIYRKVIYQSNSKL